jgi:two-component sensor histidine kinase
MLRPKAVEHIGLALHELATNATKHGALSSPTGSVKIRWAITTNGGESQQVRIEWQESGGPPVTAIGRKGFGHMVITHLVPSALEGDVSLDFPADGLRWTLVVPATNVAATIAARTQTP